MSSEQEYDTLMSVGDGLRNLEKYRLVNGLLQNPNDTNIKFRRLNPTYRNVFWVFYDELGTIQDIDSDNIYSYISSYEAVDLYILPTNKAKDAGVDINIEDPDFYNSFSYMNKIGQYLTGSNPEWKSNYYGIRVLDSIYPYPDKQVDSYTTVVWNALLTGHPTKMISYLRSDYNPEATGTTYAVANYPRPTRKVQFCYSFADSMLLQADELFNLQTGIYSTSAEEVRLKNEVFKSTIAHETGHFLSSDHPELYFLSQSIMALEPFEKMNLPSGRRILHHTNYQNHDYRYFLLSSFDNSFGGR